MIASSGLRPVIPAVPVDRLGQRLSASPIRHLARTAAGLLSPRAEILGDRVGRISMSSQMMRTISLVAIMLDEAREISRYIPAADRSRLLARSWD